MDVTFTNQQDNHPIDQDVILAAVRAVLADSPFTAGAVNVAVVDDATIEDLNRRFLDHGWPTDVLSFVLEQSDERLEGEIIVSADTAAREAPDYGWTMAEEILLYVIHGALHLVGYRDKSEEDAADMRAAEKRYLTRMGAKRERLGDSSHEADGALLPAEHGGNRAS